ncbi:hypothetical protein A0H76_3026 [Hepatospora eriocheir]|uniref:Uncharacterized protein n=1 Tax=Hepatospora eriocheir TaxID=1081669 RepID=A0A1X0QIA3_9MICR|nr:hypothetical protein A0H76_3026 [Hepatospora eriocheir]
MILINLVFYLFIFLGKKGTCYCFKEKDKLDLILFLIETCIRQ